MKEKIELEEYKERTFEDIKHIDELDNEFWEARELMEVLGYSKWGNFDKVIDKAINDYIPLVNLKYICSIKDKEGKIAGFAILVPSIAKALKKSNGKLFPFGFIRLLSALKGKNDTLEMFLIGVEPEHQKKGLPAIIMNQMLKMCIDNGVKICETGPELEVNADVQSLWKGFDARQHRRRRCFKKEIKLD